MSRKMTIRNVVRTAAAVSLSACVALSLSACGGSSAKSDGAKSETSASQEAEKLKEFSREDVERALANKEVGGQKIQTHQYTEEELKEVDEQLKQLEQVYASVEPKECSEVVMSSMQNADAGVLKNAVVALAGTSVQNGVMITYHLQPTDKMKKDITDIENQIAKCSQMTLPTANGKIKFNNSSYEPSYSGKAFEKLAGMKMLSDDAEVPSVYAIQGVLKNGQTVNIQSPDQNKTQEAFDLLVKGLKL